MPPVSIIVSSAMIWSVLGAANAPEKNPSPSPAQTAVQTEAKQTGETAPAAAGEHLVVSRAAIAPALKDNEPLDAAEKFPANVKRLYCFSQIRGAKDSTDIVHRWYWNDRLISSIPLTIRSGNWRTYSIKTIGQDMTGEWRVSIVHVKKEEVLKTLKFVVQ